MIEYILQNILSVLVRLHTLPDEAQQPWLMAKRQICSFTNPDVGCPSAKTSSFVREDDLVIRILQ